MRPKHLKKPRLGGLTSAGMTSTELISIYGPYAILRMHSIDIDIANQSEPGHPLIGKRKQSPNNNNIQVQATQTMSVLLSRTVCYPALIDSIFYMCILFFILYYFRPASRLLPANDTHLVHNKWCQLFSHSLWHRRRPTRKIYFCFVFILILLSVCICCLPFSRIAPVWFYFFYIFF